MLPNDIERNKALVRKFFDLQTTSGADPFQDFSDDATWWIAGERSKTPSKVLSGTFTGKARLYELGQFLGEVINNIESVIVTGMTAEGHRVAVEVESRIYLNSGKFYNNLYHFLFIVEEDQITAVREYLDTAHVAETFG